MGIICSLSHKDLERGCITLIPIKYPSIPVYSRNAGPCGLNVLMKGYIPEAGKRELNTSPQQPTLSSLVPLAVAFEHMGRHSSRGSACGPPGIWGRYEDTIESGVTQAGPSSVLESIRMGTPLRNNNGLYHTGTGTAIFL